MSKSLLDDEQFLQDEDEDEDFDAEAEEQDDDDEEEEEEQKDKKASKKRKKSAFIDESAEEDDDDEEEDNAGSRKRSKGAMFIDDIAAVDDEEEEEEADDYVDDMINDKDEDLGPDEGVAAAGAYRAVMREREEQTEEELEKYLQERYRYADYDYGGEEEGEQSAVLQQGLLPTINDPKLWIVQCRPGREREACMQLMQKFYTMAERNTPLGIKSAVCLDHLKGYFYVEAEKEAHVLDAIRGLRTMFISKGAKLVPLNEMVDAITVNKKAKADIQRDAWVRVKTGLYKDDLAKVIDVDHAASKASVMVVPRLDLKTINDGSAKTPFGRTPVVRPRSKPFSAAEARSLGLTVMQDRYEPGLLVLNSHRFKDGYVIRNVALKSLSALDSTPPMDEISRFNQAAQVNKSDDYQDTTSDLTALMRALPEGAGKVTYTKGDRIKVVMGDLQNLEAIVEDVHPDENRVTVRPAMDGLGEDEHLVDVAPDEIQKLFKVGDHVRVLAGQHKGEAGMVLQVQEQHNNNNICVIMSDTTKTELKVFSKDLTGAKEMATGIEILGGQYQLHDMVQLDANTVGIIVAVERGAAKVLTNQGTPAQPDVRVCKVSDIVRKLQTNRGSTTDCMGSFIAVGDMVTVTDGPAKSKQGTVHAIMRGQVFIKSPDVSDQGGFICVRNRSCKVRGGRGIPGANGDPTATPGGYAPMSPASLLKSPAPHRVNGTAPMASPQRGGPQNPWSAGPASGGDRAAPVASHSGRGGGGGYGRGGGGLVGLTVKVVKGGYSAYKGRVTQETATHVRLELDAINRIVTVPKDHVQNPLAMPGGAGRGGFGRGYAGPPGQGGYTPGGAGRGYQGPAGGYAGGYMPPQTPSHPSQAPKTPAHPSMTPLHPSMTPSHPGNATPAHPSFGTRTPMHPSLGGSSAADDVWDHNAGDAMYAATPGDYGASGYGAGAYTAPTPGTAEAPGAYADTPGVAMTPGAAATPGYDTGPYVPSHAQGRTPGVAPTPGGDMAPTPGNFAPTPGNAPTPGYDPYSLGGYAPMQTPGTVATPGMFPAGATPSTQTAYTPGFDAGIPGTPALPAPLEPQQMGPDYSGVLVKLSGNKQGVAQDVRPDGSVEVKPLDGGGTVVIDVVELVHPVKQDWVKVVGGTNRGRTGKLITIDGTEGVLSGGVVADLMYVGKLAEQSATA